MSAIDLLGVAPGMDRREAWIVLRDLDPKTRRQVIRDVREQQDEQQDEKPAPGKRVPRRG